MKPHKRIKNRKQKNTIAGLSKTVVFLMIGCLAIGILASVAARYVHETKKDVSAAAKAFYFTSDLLDGETHEIASLESDGTATITFQLMNHADELRYSEVAINYQITVTSDDASAATASVNPTKGTLESGSVQNAAITLSHLEAGKTYTVTAETKNTYHKVLSGKIKVQDVDDQVHASVQDKKNYIELTVWSADYSGNISIAYAGSLIPDNTDDLMSDAVTGQKMSISGWKQNTAHVFRFFKSTNVDKQYDVNVDGQEVAVSEK